MSGLFAGTPLERPVTCERCGLAMDECACPRGADGGVVLPSAQAVRVQRERRRGKWTTVVMGLDPVASDLPGMLKTLRKKFAAGGAVVDGTIELQGDHKEAMVKHLCELGYAAKGAGG